MIVLFCDYVGKKYLYNYEFLGKIFYIQLFYQGRGFNIDKFFNLFLQYFILILLMFKLN